MAGQSDFVPVSGEWVSGGFDIPVQQVAAPVAPVVQAAPKPMAIVLGFIERERDQVLRLLAYILKLSGKPLSRTLYLVPFKGMKIDDVMEAARAAFADVQVIRDSEGAVSDWKKGEKVRDAAGPNSLFRQAAWHFLLSKPPAGPWLWLEPDCVPLVSNWDEAIESAYRGSGKPFLGARMKFTDGSEYLNGVAVYPWDAVNRAPALVTRATWTQFPEMEIAFDVAGGNEVLRQAAVTDLIALPALDEPREGAVLFHGDRDGEILEKLLSGDNARYGRELPDPGNVEPAAQPPLLSANEGHVSTVGKARGLLQSPSQKSSTRKRGDNNGRTRKETNPTPHRNAAVGNRDRKSKAKAGGNPVGNGKNAPVTNGAEKFDPEFAPTVGDEIRYHIGALVRLASNANRKTRILKGLRKTTLLPRIAR